MGSPKSIFFLNLSIILILRNFVGVIVPQRVWVRVVTNTSSYFMEPLTHASWKILVFSSCAIVRPWRRIFETVSLLSYQLLRKRKIVHRNTAFHSFWLIEKILILGFLKCCKSYELTLSLAGYFYYSFFWRGANLSYLASKPEVVESSNFACG